MIYLLYGEDTKNVREKARSLVDSLRLKKPDASFFKMDSETFSDNELDERIASQGLFEKKYVVVLDNVFENSDAKEVILKNIKEIGRSENIFVLLEKKLDKKTLAKIGKCAEKIQEFTVKTKIKEEKKFNIFALPDAFGRRDKKEVWTIFVEAMRLGNADESIIGTLFWGIKNMIIAKDSKSASEAGLSPFVFNKAKAHSKNFKERELEEISSEIISIYHNAHAGNMEMGVALELFLLSR